MVIELMHYVAGLKSLSISSLLCVLAIVSPALCASTTWQQPTEEELKMASLPELPGASAVVLYHEEIVDDYDQS
jgi:hypothetical protein